MLEIVSQTKLLGTIIQSDLKWNSNSEMLIKKGYQRMIMLHKLYSFNIGDEDMVNIFILYIRSILEHSCQVWHHSITQEEINDFERVQKVACKIILKNRYSSYDLALDILNPDTLEDR